MFKPTLMQVMISMAFLVVSSSGAVFSMDSKDSKDSLDSMVSEEVAKSIQAVLPSTKITRIARTPIDGLYEVVTGRNIIYMQPGKNFLMVGHLFDIDASTDVTQEALDELERKQRVDWSSLPTKGRVIVKGRSDKEIAVFFDPDCQFCAEAVKALTESGVTVHYLMLPLESLHPEASEHAKAILCATDPAKALVQFMGEPSLVAPASEPCKTEKDNDLAAVASAAKQIGVKGTPYFVLPTGLIFPGFGEPVKNWLEQNGAH
jgi:thiol:disulfide interchange protein DsbC